jgi:hypothetical protein
MKIDARGLGVTTDSDVAIGSIDHFADQLLSLGPDANAIVDAAAALPDCAMVQAYAACTYVYAQSPAQAAHARRLLERARRRIDDLTERERLFIDAVDAGCRGDGAVFKGMARVWPLHPGESHVRFCEGGVDAAVQSRILNLASWRGRTFPLRLAEACQAICRPISQRLNPAALPRNPVQGEPRTALGIGAARR